MDIYDYARDENNELILSNGDFVKSESTLKHFEDIITASPNTYKSAFYLGVDAISFLLSGRISDFKQKIREQLELDSVQVEEVQVDSNFNYFVNGNY